MAGTDYDNIYTQMEMDFDISNERIFEYIKSQLWIIDFQDIQYLTQNELPESRVKSIIDLLRIESTVNNIVLESELVKTIGKKNKIPFGTLAVVFHKQLIGLLMIEWEKNPVDSYHSNIIDINVAHVIVTGRGWFRTPIHTNNIKFNYIKNYLVINQTDINVLNSKNDLRTYNKNVNHYIHFTVLELKLKLCTDTKQMNAMCGVSDGSPNQACAVCKITTQQSNSDPCPHTRNVELKDYETTLAHGLSVTRLNKQLFPNISEISVKDSEGSKFLPISYILSKDFVPCGLHYRMGHSGRNYTALQTAIVGEAVMNSTQMKKLETLDKQKYEISREIQQRTQAIYLSESFIESYNNCVDDSTVNLNNNDNNDIDENDVTVVSNQLNQLNNNNNIDNLNNDDSNIDTNNKIVDQEIIDAINGSLEDLNSVFVKIENTINELHAQLCDNNNEYKEFHEIAKEAKIRELEYRPNEVLGIDAMRLPYVYKLFMPALEKMNPEAAKIAEYLFPFAMAFCI